MTDYSLRLSDEEVRRYEFMAQTAAEEEAADWTDAGIVLGARVADVGCGPGALLAALAAAVGPDGRAVGVDQDPEAVTHAARRVAHLPQASVQAGDATDSGLP